MQSHKYPAFKGTFDIGIIWQYPIAPFPHFFCARSAFITWCFVYNVNDISSSKKCSKTDICKEINQYHTHIDFVILYLSPKCPPNLTQNYPYKKSYMEWKWGPDNKFGLEGFYCTCKYKKSTVSEVELDWHIRDICIITCNFYNCNKVPSYNNWNNDNWSFLRQYF